MLVFKLSIFIYLPKAKAFKEKFEEITELQPLEERNAPVDLAAVIELKLKSSAFMLAFVEIMTIFDLVYCFRIQRYAVIPLSTNSGLLGWVPHCDTLHTLIRDYREKKKILLNIEHRIMLRVNLFTKIINFEL